MFIVTEYAALNDKIMINSNIPSIWDKKNYF